MNESNKKPGDVVYEVSALDLLKSAGITMAEAGVDLVSTDNAYSQNYQLSMGSRLATLSELVYLLYDKHHEVLRDLSIDLPTHIVGFVVVNPLYSPDVAEGSDDADPPANVGGVDFPF